MSQPEKPQAPVPIYFCTDIETSGECYATGSMMTIGIVPVAYLDEKFQICGRSFYTRLIPRSNSDPSTMEWWRKQDRELYEETFRKAPRDTPFAAMSNIQDFIEKHQRWISAAKGMKETEAICVTAPLAFDGNFIKNYFFEYLGKDPFGHNRYIDLRSYVMGVTGIERSQLSREYMMKIYADEMKIHPAVLEQDFPLHHALGDATLLAVLWCAILTDNKRRTG